ncbi:hypothetical protein ES705_37341 [subsurface metagenome]
MIIPIVEAIAVTEALREGEYFLDTIEGINRLPIATVSATAAPEIPAKIMLARTVTCANPPVIPPTTE